MPKSPLNSRCGRRQYLITYSQADKERFPSRESFANVVVVEFNRVKSVFRASHRSCCRDLHQDDITASLCT